MRILIAPGPYKECISAEQVAVAIEQGISSIHPEYELINKPLCDGGTGFVKRLVEMHSGKIIQTRVTGPLGYEIDTFYGELDEKTAVIESAAICGLALLPHSKRNPLFTTTFGVGQLIKELASKGYKKVFVGTGDSSTNDGGVGALQALGIRFLDEDHRAIGFGGGQLSRLKQIDFSRFEKPDLEIIVACNLTSVLCGKTGTSIVYGPQKGATSKEVALLDSALTRYGRIVLEKLGEDIAFLPGGGGAGGLAGGLYAFLGAKLRYSMDVVFQATDVERQIEDVDLIITGEGKIDDKTAGGKIACGIALLGKKYAIPSIAIVGQISDDVDDVYYNGIDFILPITKKQASLEDLMNNAEEYIFDASQRLARLLPYLKSKKQKQSTRQYERKYSQKISTLLFDLGNTLAYIPEQYDMELLLAKECGFPDDETVRSIIYSLCSAYPNMTTNDFIAKLATMLRSSKSKIEEICNSEIQGAKLCDGALDILNYFKQKDYNLVLVSNTPPTTREIIKKFGFDKLFNAIILSCDVGCLKPNPQIFQIAIEKIGTSQYETCVIGDKIRTDILGGKILGTRTVLIERRSDHLIENDDRIPTDAIITNLEDLRNLRILK